MSSRPSKKRRTHPAASSSSSSSSSKPKTIGAPSRTLDSASALRGTDAPTPFASSTRRAPAAPRAAVPTLSTLCLRCFAVFFVRLRQNTELWDARVGRQLRALPDELIPRVFAVLRRECGGFLDQAFIVTYLYRGSSMTLTYASLPGVKAQTISRIASLNKGLRELEISGFEGIKDAVFADALAKLTQLRKLVLRGCTNVGAHTLHALTEHCPELRSVNLNYTSAPPGSVGALLRAHPELEVLKVAGIQSWTDATFQKFTSALSLSPSPSSSSSILSFPSLETLKLAHLALSDTAFAGLPSAFPVIFPNLRRLDLGFTLVRNLGFLFPFPAAPTSTSTPTTATAIIHDIQGQGLKLEKLNLTSTPITPTALSSILTLSPELKILSLGALGGSSSSSRSGRGGGGGGAGQGGVGMMLDDSVLEVLTDILAGRARGGRLEDVSLLGNLKLGLMPRRDGDREGEGALGRFVRVVGRWCKRLNLSGLVHLQSDDLAGLLSDLSTAPESGEVQTQIQKSPLQVPDPTAPPNLETLLLNNTPIDARAGVYISACARLETLGVAGTRVDEESLFTIIDACPRLANLDLTSCRGVKVVDRRRFFEVWEERRKTEA